LIDSIIFSKRFPCSVSFLFSPFKKNTFTVFSFYYFSPKR
jgi:hypothetical protein